MLQHCDRAAGTDSLPGQPQYQSLKLLGVEFDFRAVPDAWPMKLALVQSPRGQPDTHAVMHQNFHAVGAAIGEEIGAVRLRCTEHRHYAC